MNHLLYVCALLLMFCSNAVAKNFTLAFGILAGCGYIYSNAGRLPWPLRYAVFVLEMSLCIFLMHILNLAYDGVVLLLIADLMYCYQGRHQMIVMLLAMAVV